MNRYSLILAALFLFCLGCGGQPSYRKRIVKPVKYKITEPEKIKEIDYSYAGAKYRSPFSPDSSQSARKISFESGRPAVSAELKSGPESLKVTGVVKDSKEEYALLSGAGEFYMVKNGRLYNAEEQEISGVAAIIKEDKVVIITDKNTIYDLPVPE